MKKELIITSALIMFTCFQAVAASDINVLECTVEIGKTLQVGEELSAKLQSGELDVLSNIIEVMRAVEPLMSKCASPQCLQKIQKRCEASTGKRCEKWGAIMYPECPEGTEPFGSLCTPKCPERFRDDGLYCAKPAAYGRGVGYPWKFGDGLNLNGARSRCKAENPESGCEQTGLIIYPKCKPGFHKFGCCICTPNCPSSMTDIGVSCQKQEEERGVGYLNDPDFSHSECDNDDEKTTTPIFDQFGTATTSEMIVSLIDALKAKEAYEQPLRAFTLVSRLAGYLAALAQKIQNK